MHCKEVYLKQTALNHSYYTEVSSYVFYGLSTSFCYANISGKVLKLVLIFVH